MSKQIEAKLEELEFERKPNLHQYFERGTLEWIYSQFEKREVGEQPKILLTLKKHPRYGTNIMFTSIPPKDTYRFATMSPVNEDTAVELIEGYMESVERGEKFRD